MGDWIDRAQEREEGFRTAALAARGIRSRVTEIPPPNYGPAEEPAACKSCGGRPEVGGICGPCNCKTKGE